MLSFAYYVLDKISLLLSLSGKWLQITVRFWLEKWHFKKVFMYVCMLSKGMLLLSKLLKLHIKVLIL